MTLVGCSVIIVMNGASIDGSFTSDDEPMWRQITMACSSHARQNGSQWASVEAGLAELLGVLRERDGPHAPGRHPPDLGRHQLGVPVGQRAPAG